MTDHVRTGSPILPACGCLISLALIPLGVAGLTGSLPSLPRSSEDVREVAPRPAPPAEAAPSARDLAAERAAAAEAAADDAERAAARRAERERVLRERRERRERDNRAQAEARARNLREARERAAREGRERQAREREARIREARERAAREAAAREQPADEAHDAPSAAETPPKRREPVDHPSWRRDYAMAAGNWRGEGPYYLGVIVDVTDEDVTLVYLDGVVEDLPFDRVGPDGFKIGAAVEYLVEDGVWARARLERRKGIAARVRPEAEGSEPLWVSLAQLRLPADEPPTKGHWSSADTHAITFARYRSSNYWYPATVVEERGDMVDVIYLDGARETRSREDVRGRAYLQSTRREVEVWQDDAWLGGEVTYQYGTATRVRVGDAPLPGTWTSLMRIRLLGPP